jgi:hypothetical protein
MRRVLPLILVAAVLGGCGSDDGGGGTARFEEDGFDITFEYPGEMNKAGSVTIASGGGGSAKATAGIGYGKEDTKDVIIVQRYDLKVAVDEKNLDSAKADLDPVIARISPGAPAGTTGKTRGFPSIDYRGLRVRQIDGAETRLVALFDGDAEYLVNCQSTPKRRADIDKACVQVLRTVEKK